MTAREPSRILIVDDEPMNLDLLRQELEAVGYELDEAASGEAALGLVGERAPDLVLLDIMMPGLDGFEVCRRLKAMPEARDLPVIFMTALSETGHKLAAFAAGGVDYVTKPFETEEVLARVGTHIELRRTARALADRNRRLEEEIERHRRARQTIDHLRREIESELRFAGIVGESPAIRAVIERIDRVAATDATVLIEGETGTGKELFARAIHDRSPRRGGPLIKVNCAALPRELVESELFGHEQGAFTGASRRRKGRFELADEGTLFLDEVGELSPEAQAKLLRVLQEREFERVGGSESVAVDVRVITATNTDLSEAVRRGRFREDLFYRIAVFPVTVPPLRDRGSDVELLARHFAGLAGRRLGKAFTSISPSSLAALERYAWPGNVRELQNVIERAAILCEAPELELETLLNRSSAHAAGGTLEEVERAHIVSVLDETGWVVEGTGGAAGRLGLNASTLRGRMRKLGIRKKG